MLGVRLALEPQLGVGLLLLLVAAAAGVVTYLGLALLYERRYVLHMISMLRPARLAGSSA